MATAFLQLTLSSSLLFVKLNFFDFGLIHSLSGSHRSIGIASELVLRALASHAKPQRESKLQTFCIGRS